MSNQMGCSKVVVAVIAVSSLVVGAIAGSAAMYAAGQAGWMGSEAEAPAPPAATPQAYGLVVPIEQSLRIEGKLPRESVVSVIQKERYALQTCYQKALANAPSLAGEMSLQFTVSGDTGKVIAKLERYTDIGNDELKSCVLDEVGSWTFAKTKQNESVVRFDLLLMPMSACPDKP